jgi:hypothetical protein
MKLSIYLSLFLLISCSSGGWSSFFKGDDEVKRDKKLMQTFDVEDDVLAKFESKEKPVPKKDKVEEKQIEKKEIPKPAAPVAKVVPKPKPVKKPSPIKKEVPKVSRSIYPKDYPEDLKEISRNAKSYWDVFKPNFNPGEKVFLDINYMGVSTGKIVLSTMDPIYIGDKKAFHFNAIVKTADYYRYLYELDDTVDSYLSVERNIPLKFSLIQRESDKDIDDLQLFDLSELKTYAFYKKKTDEKTKKKKKVKYIPSHYVDPLSVIYFIRGLPMVKGKSYDIPIMNQGKIIFLNATVVGTSTIETKIGKKDAYVVKASSKYSGDTLKSGDMTFWFSTDDKRIFLKFEAKIKIGSISGDIEKYQL